MPTEIETKPSEILKNAVFEIADAVKRTRERGYLTLVTTDKEIIEVACKQIAAVADHLAKEGK